MRPGIRGRFHGAEMRERRQPGLGGRVGTDIRKHGLAPTCATAVPILLRHWVPDRVDENTFRSSVNRLHRFRPACGEMPCKTM